MFAVCFLLPEHRKTVTVVKYDFVVFSIDVKEFYAGHCFKFVVCNDCVQCFKGGLIGLCCFFVLLYNLRKFTFKTPEVKKRRPIDFVSQ